MRHKIRIALVLLLWPAFMASSVAAGIISSDLDAMLQRTPAGTEIPVIVTLSARIDLNQFKLRNAGRRAALLSALRARAGASLPPIKKFMHDKGAKRVRELWLINGLATRLPASAILQLQTLPGIGEVRLDETIRLSEVLPAATATPEWNIAAVNAPVLWNIGITGQGVVVAGMDSGVDYRHADLATRWRGGANSWYDPNEEHPDWPYDADGHGTGTMAVMVGGDATGTAIGMAPEARWIAVKIFNDAGEASTSNIHLGFQWLLDPDGDPQTNDAPRVVNNSWGSYDLVDVCHLEYQYDIEALKTAGIAVVFAAGNAGPNPASSVSPANNPGAFAVGALNPDGSIASFSSRGPSACAPADVFFPDLVAPGGTIKTADITLNGLFPDASVIASGASLAAPHVAGSMALLLQAFPNVAPAELETVLKTTARDLGTPGPDDVYGFGAVDVLAAYYALAGACVPTCDGDIDGDGDVDLSDLAVLKRDFGTSCDSLPPGTPCPADLNDDGRVNLTDLSLLKADFGRSDCRVCN
jgi:serine protease AprX